MTDTFLDDIRTHARCVADQHNTHVPGKDAAAALGFALCVQHYATLLDWYDAQTSMRRPLPHGAYARIPLVLTDMCVRLALHCMGLQMYPGLALSMPEVVFKDAWVRSAGWRLDGYPRTPEAFLSSNHRNKMEDT